MSAAPAPAEAPESGALGTNTGIASAPDKSDAYADRVSRWELLRQARLLLRGRDRWIRRKGEDKQVPFRVGSCQYRIAKDPEGIEAPTVGVYRTNDRAWFQRVHSCGSPWHCPICAARIARTRREYLRELERQAAAQRMGIGMQTLTIPHGAGDDLTDTLARLSDARRKMRSGRAWQRFRDKWGWVGEARTLETTHGWNGWHPHFHGLHFCEDTPRGHDKVRFRRELYLLWARACKKAGLPLPSYKHGVDVAWGNRSNASGDAVADYIAKWGFAGEVTGAQAKWKSKGGLTPWQLLAASKTSRRARALWIQYAEAFEGRNQLVVTPGLKKRLQPAQLELDDLEAAQPENSLEPGEVPVQVGRIPAIDWHRVCRAHAHERILEAAMEGAEALEGELDRLRRCEGSPPDTG